MYMFYIYPKYFAAWRVGLMLWSEVISNIYLIKWIVDKIILKPKLRKGLLSDELLLMSVWSLFGFVDVQWDQSSLALSSFTLYVESCNLKTFNPTFGF